VLGWNGFDNPARAAWERYNRAGRKRLQRYYSVVARVEMKNVVHEFPALSEDTTQSGQTMRKERAEGD
jgi:hypothetical protein